MGRTAHVNKDQMERAIANLSKRHRLRLLPGYSNERVIFRGTVSPRGPDPA